jgi:hypothetical protein
MVPEFRIYRNKIVGYLLLPTKTEMVETLADRRYSSFNFLTKSFQRSSIKRSSTSESQDMQFLAGPDQEKIKQMLIENDMQADIEDSLNLMVGKRGAKNLTAGVIGAKHTENNSKQTGRAGLEQIDEDAFDSDIDSLISSQFSNSKGHTDHRFRVDRLDPLGQRRSSNEDLHYEIKSDRKTSEITESISKTVSHAIGDENDRLAAINESFFQFDESNAKRTISSSIRLENEATGKAYVSKDDFESQLDASSYTQIPSRLSEEGIKCAQPTRQESFSSGKRIPLDKIKQPEVNEDSDDNSPNVGNRQSKEEEDRDSPGEQGQEEFKDKASSIISEQKLAKQIKLPTFLIPIEDYMSL